VAVLPEPSPADDVLLTPRERRVLVLVAGGKTSRDIAEELGIRPRTVRTHVEHVLRKLGVHTRAEAVARAFELGTLAAAS
jgi:DNA-binding CsgD family transcriptional regulator